MIRLTELKLPLDHAPSDLDALVFERLSLAAQDIAAITVFKRSIDARKAEKEKSKAAILAALQISS